ncbi:hypothetical protein R1sor_008034 [Riccia sorocarpa]|uniref:BRCT domain-containing protein n=1 Tax=Riccia sorocarpa TaxID=122646 RepID=A0ABD3HS79_9MARC
MPPRSRPVPKGRAPSAASGAPTGSHIVVIGNCRLDVPDALGYELSHEGFSANIQDIGTLKVYEAVTRVIAPPLGLSFTLLNPKNVDDSGKLLLQDVLHLYNVELPAMSFAANTGKESPFLESCIMDGKYCTLILRKNEPGSHENELVAAVTFQILPPDTQQAEIPLSAVRYAHQRKGYGSIMFKELKRRLMEVGVTSIFCWGDAESEVFWSKQGFVKVAEVDGRGKPKKLPIKGELKKAMSIPGSATLMISHLDDSRYPTAVSVPAEHLKEKEVACYGRSESHSPPPLESAKGVQRKSSLSPPSSITTPQLAGDAKSSVVTTPQQTVGKSSITPLNMDGKIFSATASGADAEEPDSINALAIVPVSVPDSEPLDLSGNPGHCLPVADITNTIPNGRTRGALPKRTYTRRQQTMAKSPGIWVPDSVSPTTSGKENNGEANEIVCREPVQSSAQGKLSAFLGPRKKATHSKNGASTPSGNSSGELVAAPVKAAVEVKLSSDNKTGSGVEDSESLLVKDTVSEAQLKPQGGKLKKGDQLPVKAGIKRGRPPKAPAEKDQKATPSDQTKQKPARGKRGKISASGEDGKSKQATTVSCSEIPLEEGENAVEEDERPDNVEKGASTSGSAEPDTGTKRGRQEAKAKGKRAKRRKHVTFSKKVKGNEEDVGGQGAAAETVQDPGQQDDDTNEVGAEVQNREAGSDASALVEVREDGSCTNSANVPSAAGNVPSAPSDQTPTEGRGSELTGTIAAESDQEVKRPKYVIMFMNMADEKKKRQLSTHVEKLGGLVTCEGSKCTHVVTMEVRRTLNFCVAVSSGAWILSPDWLKASVKQKAFAAEEGFILKDKKFEAKYNLSLKDVIPRARQMPNLLLDGLYIYPSPHVHPPVSTISDIIKAAGGQVVGTLEEVVKVEKKSCGIVVTCEEDMEEAMVAAKAGLRTYNSDWLLTCVVKQELDFNVAQFTESL